MKFIFDLFPIILFFVTFKSYGIYAATAVAIAATFAQISWVWFRHRKVDNMLWISLVIIVIFGSATLILQDETFIKWKPSVLYWSFAAVLSLAALFWNKNLIRSIMGQQITLPDPVWRILNHAWAGFFAALGIANLYVAFNFATDTWVNFKLFGTTGLMLTFVIAQSLFIAKYMKEPEQCSMSSSNDASNNQEKP
ncbi:septation protein A [Nitrosomonas sp. Nm132]|uniref:septation protein A n=1 Tax=Nitrosomonas sp. Nm132 TaxID=1881053 RepID=UPI00087FDC4F|nr:septation protein A [Nitrosomonas sp. Nm132]SDH96822.1 intracellular septation protein [Nitrosomonas sp. Nm132]